MGFEIKSVTLLAAVLVTTVSASQTLQEIGGTKLLMTSVRTGDTEVFVIDPVTGDAQNITKAPLSEERYPTWMPDGAIVFTSNRDDGKTFNLYLVREDGSGLQNLTKKRNGEVFYFPSVQRDGKRIWFSVARGEKSYIGYVTPDGSDYHEVAEGRDGAISPGGNKIAFTQRAGKGFSLFVMDDDGSNAKQVTLNENEIGAVAPAWSPDGKRIAYADQVGDHLEIFITDPDGKDIKQIITLKKFSSSPAWSPDGKFITFRVTDVAYWRDAALRDKAYADKQADIRPVCVTRSDNSAAPVIIETLHYQCGIDGSRAEWKPFKK